MQAARTASACARGAAVARDTQTTGAGAREAAAPMRLARRRRRMCAARLHSLVLVGLSCLLAVVSSSSTPHVQARASQTQTRITTTALPPIAGSAVATAGPPRASHACAFFEQQVAHEFIVRMRAYDALAQHEQYVSSALEQLLPRGTSDSQTRRSTGPLLPPRTGVAVVKRSRFAYHAPSDFVVLQLFHCSASAIEDARTETTCHAAERTFEDAAHVMRADAAHQIAYVQRNRVYRDVALLSQPERKPSTAASRTLKARHHRRRKQPKALTDELGIQALWDRGFTGKGVKIGVFDTGLSSARFQHVKERINWTHERKNEDVVGHGTFVAGVISGTDAQCPGIAPDAELYVFRMFTTEQLSFTSWFLDAFNYALFQGIHTLNLSTGGPDFRDRPFVEKIQELAANGVIIVSAVGNSGPKYGTLTNPADQMEVIGVGGVTHDGDVADFSSRGMTTWELPFGAGRVKPDIVTLAEDIPGFEVARGCTLLSGTSVSAPIVTGAIALLASMVPPEHRWTLLNPASVKQLLIESADRLTPRTDARDYVVRNHIFEQGSGKLNVSRASERVLALWERHQAELSAAASSPAPRTFSPSSYPDNIDATNCPYMWPLCSQPLYHSSLPLMVNLTLLNPSAIAGVLDATPQWIAAEHGDALAVSVASPAVLWPYFGSVGVFVEVTQKAAAFRGVASGTLSLAIRNGDHVDTVLVPIRVAVVPTPPAAKRILWDQFHNIPYPSAFVPRDKLEHHHELLDGAGDHPHTNFHQLWNFLVAEGYFVEILPFEYSCLDLAQYGVVLLVDPEEAYFQDEVLALSRAIKYANVSLLVFADWYDDAVLDTMDVFDTSTLSHWRAITGGANIPALNTLLKDFSIELGTGAFSSASVALLATDSDSDDGDGSGRDRTFPYWSGSHIIKFPVGGYLGRVDGVDQSAMMLNQSDVPLTDVPVLGLYQVPSKHGGRIAVFGDSSCIDASVHPSSTGFVHCFSMVRQLLRFTNDGVLPDAARPSRSTSPPPTRLEAGAIAPRTTATAVSPQLEHLAVEFTGGPAHSTRRLASADAAALTLRTAAPPPRPQGHGRAELKKHSKVLLASDRTPERQSFCHFYHKQECNVATRVTIAAATPATLRQLANATRH